MTNDKNKVFSEKLEGIMGRVRCELTRLNDDQLSTLREMEEMLGHLLEGVEYRELRKEMMEAYKASEETGGSFDPVTRIRRPHVYLNARSFRELESYDDLLSDLREDYPCVVTIEQHLMYLAGKEFGTGAPAYMAGAATVAPTKQGEKS